MKKLLLLTLITFTNVSYASFPVFSNHNDPEEDIGVILEGIASIILTFFLVRYLFRLYKNSFNPWLRFLGLFGLIICSLFLLIGLFLVIIGGIGWGN